ALQGPRRDRRQRALRRRRRDRRGARFGPVPWGDPTTAVWGRRRGGPGIGPPRRADAAIPRARPWARGRAARGAGPAARPGPTADAAVPSAAAGRARVTRRPRARDRTR